MTTKQQLIDVMNALDFAIADLALGHDGSELVGKKKHDGSIIFWSMELEGSGFKRMFEGRIRKVLKNV